MKANICSGIKVNKEECLHKTLCTPLRTTPIYWFTAAEVCNVWSWAPRHTTKNPSSSPSAKRVLPVRVWHTTQKNLCPHSAALTRNITHCFSVWKIQSREHKALNLSISLFVSVFPWSSLTFDLEFYWKQEHLLCVFVFLCSDYNNSGHSLLWCWVASQIHNYNYARCSSTDRFVLKWHLGGVQEKPWLSLAFLLLT